MKTVSAVRRTTSSMVWRPSEEAVTSRKTSSSAPGRVVRRAQLDRVAGVAQVDEVDALDHPPGVHVEAGDHAYRHRHTARVRDGPAEDQAERRAASASGTVNAPA